jgi:hypothetical protein
VRRPTVCCGVFAIRVSAAVQYLIGSQVAAPFNDAVCWKFPRTATLACEVWRRENILRLIEPRAGGSRGI